MIKYIILCVVAILCGYIGYGISRYYVNRSKFFKSLGLLFEKLKTEISFSQNKLIEILKDFSCPSKDAKILTQNFVDCLLQDLSITKDNLFKEIKILNDEEKKILEIFFKTLGKFDALNQTNQLENQRIQIEDLYKKAEAESKKYSPLYTKLGVILGLVIALIFA